MYAEDSGHLFGTTYHMILPKVPLPTMLTVAFCYDLKSDYLAQGYTKEECLELDSEDTIDVVAGALKELGHTVVRVGNIQSLVKHLAHEQNPAWDLVFNISEGMFGIGREAQVTGLLEAYRIPCTFSDAATLAVCLDKGKTKMIVEALGVPSAPYAIVSNTSEDKNSTKRGTAAIATSPFVAQLSYPLFAKPIAEGSSKGVLKGSRINGPDELDSTVGILCAQFPGQAILIEKYLAGREITVGIVGTGKNARVLGALEFKSNLDEGVFLTYESKNVADCPDYSETQADMKDPAVKLACETALKAWKVLGCRDAGRVDMRFDKRGEEAIPHFMEVNPLAGLKPNWSHLPIIAAHNNITFVQLIDMIVKSAVERIKK